MDTADRAQEVEEMERAQALARRAVVEVPRMDGDVRVCLRCDEAIELPRLAANPHAVRCITCQTRHEKRR